MLLVFLFGNYMVLTKAAHIPITYDEAFSYMNYARSLSGFWTLHIANNHYLNSLAMYISSFMFGNEPFILRLPNIVSFYIYSLAAYVVSCRLPLKAFAFSVLVANALLLDFFSLARGYGIAATGGLVGFAILSTRVSSRGLCVRLSAGIALFLSSTAFPPMAVALVTAMLIFAVRDIRNRAFTVSQGLCLVGYAAAFVLFAWITYKVSRPGLPLYATHDILSSLASPIASFTPDLVLGHRDCAAFIFLAVLGLTIIVTATAGVASESSLEATAWCLLILTGAIFIPAALGRPLPVGRGMLPFLPILMLGLLICWGEHWRRFVSSDIVSTFVSLTLAPVIVLLCAWSSSLTRAYDWPAEEHIDVQALRSVWEKNCATKEQKENWAFLYYLDYFFSKNANDLPDCS
jgi:hypothetical protein